MKNFKELRENQVLSEMAVSRKDFDKIKKNDVIEFVFDSSMKKGHKVKLKVKSKTRSNKYNVDKINMVDATDPRNRTKFTLFSRGGKDATLGWGGMGVVIKSYKIGVKEGINEDYAQDLDLAQKNVARLAKKEKGQDQKDYMAVARALNQGNLGAVKKVIKSISTDEIRADILNILVGYNDLIAKMYPKAVDAKGNLKRGLTVGKMIKEDGQYVNPNNMTDKQKQDLKDKQQRERERRMRQMKIGQQDSKDELERKKKERERRLRQYGGQGRTNEAVLNFDNVPKGEHPQFMKHVKKAKLKVKSVQGDRIVLDGGVNQFDVFFNSIKKDKTFMKNEDINEKLDLVLTVKGDKNVALALKTMKNFRGISVKRQGKVKSGQVAVFGGDEKQLQKMQSSLSGKIGGLNMVSTHEAVSRAQQAAIAISKKEKQEECKDEKDFKPHMMYDPKTGKGVKANTYADHLKYDKMGYTHEPVKEAMSPKDKAKRLAMIRKAVEKINARNAEKAKKDALKMMKDSGMFEESVDLSEVTDQEINAVKKLSKDIQKVKTDYFKIAKMGDKTLKMTKYNKRYESILKAQQDVLKLIGDLSNLKMMQKESTDLTEKKSNIDQIRDIVKTKGAKKVGGVMVDMFTASAIVKVYDAINDTNKAKMDKMTVPAMANVAYKIINKNR
jgi:DNA-directed RNA polymerase subunit H (RpoH/RPB5)